MVAGSLYGLAAVLGAGLTIGLEKFARLGRSANVASGALFAAGCAGGVYQYRRGAQMRRLELFCARISDPDLGIRLKEALRGCDRELLDGVSLEFDPSYGDSVLSTDFFDGHIELKKGGRIITLLSSELAEAHIDHALAYDLTVLKYAHQDNGRGKALAELVQKLFSDGSVTCTERGDYEFQLIPSESATLDGRRFRSTQCQDNSLQDFEVRRSGLAEMIHKGDLLQPS